MASSETPLASRHVRLAPPSSELVQHLFRLAATGAIDWPWRGRREVAEGFHDSLSADVLTHFAIEDRRTGQPVGWIAATEPNPFHGYAYVNMVLLPTHRGRVWPLEAVVLFANLLFVRFNLRNLYGRATAAQLAQFRSGAGRYFEIEARLKGHLLVNRVPQDLCLLTVTEQRWAEVGPALLKRIAA